MKKKRTKDHPDIFRLIRKGLLIMKLSLLLIVVGVLQSAASVYSQTWRMNLNEKSMTVKEVLNRIESTSEFRFFYEEKKIDVERKITIDVSDASITEVLSQLFDNEGVEYKIFNNNYIVLKPNGENSTFLMENAQQQKSVSGKVTDSSGATLPGVSVVVKGTTNGSITDGNGNYSISRVPENAILQFSFVGMKMQEVKVGTQTSIDVTMTEDAIGIDEVIAVGYGTTTKSNLTTSVSQVKPGDIPASANNSVNQLLFGRAAGLNVSQQSAEPGGNINLSIRGRGNPLVIIDGIVVPGNGLEPGSGNGELNGVKRGGLSDLNPADIESIEVLKDASSAIYGVAAADGVILITTKKGKLGKMNISYDGSRSMMVNMPYLEPLNAQEYMSYYNQFSKDRYLFDNKMGPFGTVSPSGFTPQFSDSQIQNAGKGTDWLNEVLRNGSADNHTININGGTEKMIYYFSGNYFNQVGTMKNSDMSRYNTRMNLTFAMTDFLKLNASMSYTRNNYTNSTAGWQTGGSGSNGFGALQAALSYPSYLPVKDGDGNYSQFATTGNPVTLLNINDHTQSSGIMANFSMDIDIIKKMLSVRLLYGNNFEAANRSLYIPSNVFWGQIYQSRGSLTGQQRQNQTMEATMSFKKALGKIANLDAVAGMGQYVYDDNGYGMQASDMLDAVSTYNMGAAPKREAMSSYKNYEKKRSYFARTNFDILDRYLVSMVYRLDGIDKFYPDNKYAGFPSVSLGWKINNESFMKSFSKLNLLKIRASIGITGRPIGSAAYGQYSADSDQAYFDNGATIYTPYYQTRFDQPDLKWEKTQNKNIGLDFGFFKNRISGTVDVFSDKVTNLLTSRSTDQLSYIGTAYENDGSRVRSGWEVSLKTVNFVTRSFQWDMIFNATHYNYFWDKRFQNQDLQLYVGEKDPVNAIYVFETNGILQIGEAPSAWQPAKAQMPGAPKFVDLNGDKKLDYQDVKMFTYDPKIVLGWGNDFKYKNLDMSIFFYGQFGAYDFNNTLQWADPKKIASGTMGATKDIKNSWSTSNPNGIWPGAGYDETILGLSASIDTRLASKNFVRCRNITFGYTFKQPAVTRYFSNLRAYVDVQNPFIITKYVGGDPEVQAGAVKGAPAPYPMARTYSFGVNVTF